ncbi:MAG TPA: HAD-IA family hydrolase [Dongiaceae bacterium]|nr:HAD-IA family hydrolase [Dongiaceae bacterium]
MPGDLTKPGGDDLLQALGKIRLIVFDCDGTLIDSQRNIIAAVEQVFASIGMAAPDPDVIRRQVGLSAEAAIAGMLPDAAPEVHQQVVAAFHRLRPILQQREKLPEPLYPGILPLIGQLEHPEVFLGIATGKSYASLQAVLAEHRLTDRFHTLQTGDRSRGKPHPEMMLRAIAETGLSAAEAVMLGDTAFDMEMARAAGSRAIGVSWGYHSRNDLERAGADAVIDHPVELLPALRRLV